MRAAMAGLISEESWQVVSQDGCYVLVMVSPYPATGELWDDWRRVLVYVRHGHNCWLWRHVSDYFGWTCRGNLDFRNRHDTVWNICRSYGQRFRKCLEGTVARQSGEKQTSVAPLIP